MPDSPGRSRLYLLQKLATALGLVATLVVLALFGFWRMFSVFPLYDDEGCMLITLQQFLEGHALYDEVFSMYGPFPVLVKWALFALSGQPVGHSVGRVITLGLWLATALTCGVAAGRMTRSLVGGYAGTVYVFLLLWTTIYEPGHPQDLCAILLALTLLLATFARSEPRGPAVAAGLGVLAGCLAMTKINIFIFLIMALGGAALAFTPERPLTRVLTIVYAVGLLAAPGILMRGFLGDPSMRAFALHVTLTLIAPLIVGFGRRRAPFLGVRHYAGFAGAFSITLAVIAGLVMYRGTTPYGLLDGVLLNPLRVATLYVKAVSWYRGRWAVPVAFAIGALAWLVLLRSAPTGRTQSLLTRLSAVLRISVGLVLLGSFGGQRSNAFEVLPVFGLPAMVLLLLRADDADDFARFLLALLAVTVSLWAFPVAGSQKSFICYLPALALIIVLFDGCQELAASIALGASAAGRAVRPIFRTVLIFLLAADSLHEAEISRRIYRDNNALGLRGTPGMRLIPRIVYRQRRLTALLRDQPDTFLTMPGMYSMYFWAGREPPTTLNLTNWMYMLDDRKQARIVEQLAAHPRACVVVSSKLVDFWMQGRPLPETPLVRYIHANFIPSTEVDDVTIWVPKLRDPHQDHREL